MALNLDSTKEIKIKNKLIQIQNSLNNISVQLSQEDMDFYKEMLNLYTKCLNRRITSEDISSLEFIFTSTHMIIYSERCYAHYNRNVDALWLFTYNIKLKNWEDFLTAYGKSVIDADK